MFCSLDAWISVEHIHILKNKWKKWSTYGFIGSCLQVSPVVSVVDIKGILDKASIRNHYWWWGGYDFDGERHPDLAKTHSRTPNFGQKLTYLIKRNIVCIKYFKYPNKYKSTP